ncbi:MAG: hypothetical protein FJZ01_25305 [Candidatus Sericytochromatia bacterium]|nr:hypothetical protein [Candidatus Tanganyikabacteria bacterium]
MVLRHARHALVPAAAAILAACGGPPPTVVDDGKNLGNLKIIQSPPQAQPGAPAPDQVARQLLADIAAVRQTTRNLKCELTGFFVNINTQEPGSTLSDFHFEKPNKTSLTIKKSSDPRKVGTKVVWLGGAKMAVRTKFLGFWLSVSVDVHDDRARDPRGYFIDETGLESTLLTLLDTRNQVKYEGAGQLDNLQVARLGIVSPRSLKGIKREVFVVDTQRKVPVVREMYDGGGKLVFRIKMDRIQLNTALPANTFKID